MRKKLQKASETARAHLKTCTHSAHQRLHELPHFARLHRGTSSLEDYAELMSGLHAFYNALDTRVMAACRRHLDANSAYTYQPRAPLLEADIVAVGRRLPDRASAQTQMLHRDLPVIDNHAALAGVIYVVDGATLGGRLLNRSAEKLLGCEDSGGRSYWQWCECHGAQQWKAALALIDRVGQETTARLDMTKAALATFETLESHFREGRFAQRPSVDLAGAA